LVVWLVGLIAVSIGLPFATLRASAPLLQSWYAASGGAGNPSVLYAASNIGSFVALLAYPFAIEPMLALRTQAWTWSIGYGVLSTLLALTGIQALLGTQAPGATEEASAPLPTVLERVAWIVLAAIPSGLVVAVTAHITTDIAAAPFLWVVPLALYLLTFVAVFRDRPWISDTTPAKLAPFAVAPLAIGLLDDFWLGAVVLNLAAF